MESFSTWNHAPWTDHSENPDYFAHNIIEQAKEAGFHVEKDSIRGTLEARPRYKESHELSDAIDFITHSRRKSRTTSKYIRDKQKYDRQRAFQWNISRYRYQFGRRISPIALETAHYMRMIRENAQSSAIIYLATELTECMKQRHLELAARMNYPELVTVDLMGNDISDLPF